MPWNPFNELIRSTVGRVVEKLVERYLPASVSEKEKEEFKLRAQELVLKEIGAEAKVMESVNATMREEARSEHWMQYSWRPTLGFTFAAVIVNNYILLPYFKGVGLMPIDIPAGIWEAMLIVLGVAAGTRGLEKWQREKN
ncbi:MAG TPA: hypothetical protein DDW94_02535 [Deltaproteobacteria bacterium]|nr:MAG: hypothetical protein A2Z79_09305 [Deltaproteobacteria bacterium GWA2_55_82]OGQ64729.1 MAG: hypothetical protein A3I81_07725 [Deltaproteobacteria bacterium RIFCSPLOWO2_02_FULL_55_12]OIJ73758.1 MAG: hypothetical protein A2V21_305445 [Deltaproteobacteria bacterium GWC2_55_46]HBG45844.1 hypothetical protein [Deltaproteobacteria bacterium]HCY09737.1 hypothetical protein [Deltaproteobacteria bacterium]